MEITNFYYNDKAVDFMPHGDDDVMVNATQMSKIFGKNVEPFTRNVNTKNFLNECLKSENSRFLNIKNTEDLIVSKQNSGTWMHRILALKFAAWLNPAFELWVFVTIDKILHGYYKEMREATIEKLKVEKELAAKKEELIINNPGLVEYFELEGKLNAADKRRLKALKASSIQLKINLFS